MGKIKVDWLEAQRRLYNGTFPGPTLRFRAGDRLDVDLVSLLSKRQPRSDNRLCFCVM